ncbi:MAG: cytochrome c [Planctomycetaceae bacterium]|nr:cytochrome c [Planctomycetaceae bacterium]
MTSWFRLALIAGSLILAGCGETLQSGPLMKYVESERLTTDLKDKPKLRQKVRKALADLFGPDPQHIHVPSGSGLPNAGIHLADRFERDEGGRKVVRRVKLSRIVVPGQPPIVEYQEGGYALYRRHCLHCHGVSGAGDGPTAEFLYPRPRDYRKGLFKFTSTPLGEKPTREDLRKTINHGLHGTSMPAFEAQMSPFEIEQVIDYMTFLSMRGETELALIEEATLADEGDAEALSPDTAADLAKAVFNKWKKAEAVVMNPPVPRMSSSRASILRGRHLFLGGAIKSPQGQEVKVDCVSCHGPRAIGNGPSFVAQEIFNTVVFNGKISRKFVLTSGELEILQALTDMEAKGEAHAPESGGDKSEAKEARPTTLRNLVEALRKSIGLGDKDDLAAMKLKMGYTDYPGHKVNSFERIVEAQLDDLETKGLVSRGFGLGATRYHALIDRKTGELWNNSLDEWGNPLRPANLNRGVYKGGRRPIDLYWRIAKGINGAKMPAHYPTLDPERIWDLVNFVLALPYEPKLLEGATPPGAVPAPPSSAVARR